MKRTREKDWACFLILENGTDGSWRRIGIAHGAADLDNLRLEKLVIC